MSREERAAPKTIQETILARTWAALEAAQFDSDTLLRLRGLSAAASPTHRRPGSDGATRVRRGSTTRRPPFALASGSDPVGATSPAVVPLASSATGSRSFIVLG
jgi:hypothetical protein